MNNVDIKEIVLFIIGGGGIVSTVVAAYINRKKTKSEVRHSEIDAEQKIKDYKDKSMLNAYEEINKLEEKIDSMREVNIELNDKIVAMAKCLSDRAIERQKESDWRSETDRKLHKITELYERCRCDRFDCLDRIPPLRRTEDGKE